MATERAYNDAKRGIRYRPPPAVAGAPAPVFWLTPADGREVLCVLHGGCVYLAALCRASKSSMCCGQHAHHLAAPYGHADVARVLLRCPRFTAKGQ